MAITPDDKKISQFPEVTPSEGMFIPLIDLDQSDPSLRNVRATVAAILALVPVGVGTVTDFSAGNLSPLFTTSVATSTSTPALSFALTAHSANQVFAGPTGGGSAAPTFRALVAADIPNLTSIYQPLDADLTAIAALGTTAYGRGFLTQADASAARTYIGAGTGSGTVTSVDLTAPAAGITVSGGPITTSGSITLALADDLAALEALTGTDTIYYRSGVSTWTPVTIGTNLLFTGGTLSASAPGTGTVTSFSAGNLSPLFTTNVATATTTPALTFTLSNQSANLVFAGPTNGAAAAPTFRSLVAADIPDLSATYQPLNANLTAISALTTTSYGLDFLELADAAAARAYIGAGTGSGTVTSVALTMPTGFSVGGSPITTSGTFAVTTTLSGIVVGDGSGLITRTATGTADRISITNGSGVAGNPTFDIAATYVGQTSITTLGTITTGTWSATTIAAARGGTGQTTYAEGDLLYGNGSGTLSKLAFPIVPAQVLVSGGSAPQWVAYSTISVTGATGTANQVLVNGTSGSAQTGNITLTTPQDIGTISTPQFAQLGLGGSAVSTHAWAVHSSTVDMVAGNSGVQAFFPALAGRGLFIQRNGIAGAHLFSAAQSTTFVGVSTEGTLASPTATGSDRGTSLVSGAYDGTNYFVSANVVFETTEAQTASLRGSRIRFNTILTGATSLAERMRISGAGNLLVGTTSDVTGPGKIKALGIEDTPIGATTPSTGAFTTITASGAITRSGLIAASPAIAVAGTDTVSQALLQVGINTADGGSIGSRVVLIDAGTSGKRWDLASGFVAGGFTIRNSTDAVTAFQLTNTGINSTAIGATTPSTGAFTTFTSSGTAPNFGPGGTGSSTLDLKLDGGSASAGGPYISFRRNGTAQVYIGTESGIIGNNSNALALYGGSNDVKVWAGGAGNVGTFTSTGINSTAIGATTPSTGVFTALRSINSDSAGPFDQVRISGGRSLGANVFGSAGSILFSNGYWNADAGAAAISGIDNGASGGELWVAVTTSGGGVAGTPVTVGRFTSTGINSTAIGATTPSTGAFTTLSANTSIVYSGATNGGLQVTDGTVSGIVFTTSSTSMTIGTQTNHPMNVFINNGSIGGFTTTGLNGMAIGATTPSTGVFTTVTASSGVTVGTTALISSSVALSSTPGAGAGTLTNAPAAGNPTKWLRINDNGTPIYIPAWAIP